MPLEERKTDLVSYSQMDFSEVWFHPNSSRNWKTAQLSQLPTGQWGRGDYFPPIVGLGDLCRALPLEGSTSAGARLLLPSPWGTTCSGEAIHACLGIQWRTGGCSQHYWPAVNHPGSHSNLTEIPQRPWHRASQLHHCLTPVTHKNYVTYIYALWS